MLTGLMPDASGTLAVVGAFDFETDRLKVSLALNARIRHNGDATGTRLSGVRVGLSHLL